MAERKFEVMSGANPVLPASKDACVSCGCTERVNLYRSHLPGSVEMRQCVGCGHCAVMPMVDRERLLVYYRETYTDSDYFYAAAQRSAGAYWCKLQKHFPTGKFRMLDVGGGCGFLSDRVRRERGADILLLEIGNAAREHARDVLGLRVAEGFVEDFQTEERFEVIVAVHVAEHVADFRRFLASCRELLVPGGRLILLTPDAEAWKLEWLGKDWAWAAPEQHTLFLSKKSAEHLLNSGGFEPQTIRALVASMGGYPWLVTHRVSKWFTQRFGRGKSRPGGGDASKADSQDGIGGAGRTGLFKRILRRLRPAGRVLLWAEYAVLTTLDRIIACGRKSDELLIVAARRENAPEAAD